MMRCFCMARFWFKYSFNVSFDFVNTNESFSFTIPIFKLFLTASLISKSSSPPGVSSVLLNPPILSNDDFLNPIFLAAAE